MVTDKKFTPGKWEQSHRQKRNGMYSTEVYSETGETIATIAWYPMPPKKELVDCKFKIVTGTYRQANAKLIAAAPELLEALKLMVARAELKDNNNGIAINAAKQAIKKATE